MMFPSGFGWFKGADGDEFFGEYESGMRNGNGTAYFTDGTQFQGTFLNDKVRGPVECQHHVVNPHAFAVLLQNNIADYVLTMNDIV